MEEAGEFQEWEVLPKSDAVTVSAPVLVVNSGDFEGIDGDSEGVIRSDYFAFDSEKRYAKTVEDEEDGGEGFVDSDNPSWVDPCSTEVGFHQRRNSGEFWSDSGSDGSRKEPGFGDDGRKAVGVEGIEGTEIGNKGLTQLWSDSGGDYSHEFKSLEGKGGLGTVDNGKEELGFDGNEIRSKDSDELRSESGFDEYVRDELEDIKGESELVYGGKVDTGNGSVSAGDMEVGDGSNSAAYVKGEEGEFSAENGKGEAAEVNSGEGEKKRVVWWKLPLELLKFCAFRVSPVWSFSIAAAVMGFIILGKRLYRMNRKARSIPLKVSMEDKKASQFMISAARLNEAFSVVKRVPIRSSLPAAGGLTPWPVMGLR